MYQRLRPSLERTRRPMETTLRDLLLQRGSWARHAAGDWAWLGWEGGSTPAGGTGVVPSRRPGGPASQWWQRRSRRPPVTPQTHPRTDGLDRRGSVVGGRTSGACRRERSARRMAGPDSPTANAAGAEVFQGDRRGAAAPLASRNVKRCVCWLPDHNSRSQPSAEPPKRLSGGGPEQRPPSRCGQPFPASLIASFTDGEGDGRPRHLPGDSGGSLPTAAFRPTSTPREPEIVDLRRSQRP